MQYEGLPAPLEFPLKLSTLSSRFCVPETSQASQDLEG